MSTEKFSGKKTLLHSIENHRSEKNEQITTNTTTTDKSETYWKSITEQRRRAIEETKVENEQLHGLIEDLSKENEQLRSIAHHCNYLQNVLEKLTTDRESFVDETHDE